MRLSNLPISWFDFVVMLIVLVGISRGRKRGMSEELLDVLKWVAILVLASHFYLPIAISLSQASVFSLFFCSIVSYSLIILSVMLFVSFLKRHLGDKLVGSDVFGGGEYYLGMVGGAIRYVCVILVALAFLNARYYSPEEIQSQTAFQEQYFGDIRFPTICSLQQEVFAHSFTGQVTRDYLSSVLIQSTAPEDKGLGRAGVVRARESAVNQLLERR